MNNQEDIWKVALNILGRRSYSEYELRQKLQQKGYVIEQIDDVINRLLTYDYVNDRKLAKNLFQKYLQVNKYSFNNIVCKLKQHGLSDDIIKDTTSTYDSEEEWRSALKIVNNRFKSLDDMTKEKIYRFLATRGFSTSIIHRVSQQIFHSEI